MMCLLVSSVSPSSPIRTRGQPARARRGDSAPRGAACQAAQRRDASALPAAGIRLRPRAPTGPSGGGIYLSPCDLHAVAIRVLHDCLEVAIARLTWLRSDADPVPPHLGAEGFNRAP